MTVCCRLAGRCFSPAHSRLAARSHSSSPFPRRVCQTFRVVVNDLSQNEETVHEFDWVVCATGHFSVPHVPEFPGFDTFPGRLMHAHDFRRTEEFVGKNLLLVGASYSAEDIGLQCKKYGAKSITFTTNSLQVP